LGIQVIVVFDGPGKPWKGGKVSGRVEEGTVRDTKELLEALGVPWYVAPGEAEAECAALQMEGVVDAVWSEDADALMFGAGVLMRDYREPATKAKAKSSTAETAECEDGAKAVKTTTKKSTDTVVLHRTSTLRVHLGLDREALVLFTILTGGDYDIKGLPGCGPKRALPAAQQRDLAHSLAVCRTQRELDSWRVEKLTPYFQSTSPFAVPFGWPRELVVRNYSRPKVSPPETLRNLRALRRGWSWKIDERKLAAFVSSRFDLWTKRYWDWIAPILFVRVLLRVEGGVVGNLWDVKLCRRRAKKKQPGQSCSQGQDKGEEDDAFFVAQEEEASAEGEEEIKLTFPPLHPPSIRTGTPISTLSLNPENLQPGHWTGGKGFTSDAEEEAEMKAYRVECSLPRYLLLRGLGAEALKALEEERDAPPAKKAGVKRKRGGSGADEGEVDDDGKGEHAEPSKPRQRKKRKSADVGDGASVDMCGTSTKPKRRKNKQNSPSDSNAEPRSSDAKTKASSQISARVPADQGVASKKRARSKKDPIAPSSSANASTVLSTPPQHKKATFRLPTAFADLVADFGLSPTSSEQRDQVGGMAMLHSSGPCKSGSSDRAIHTADPKAIKRRTHETDGAMLAHKSRPAKPGFSAPVVDLDTADVSPIGRQWRTIDDEEARQLELAIQLSLRETQPEPSETKSHANYPGGRNSIRMPHIQGRSPHQAIHNTAFAIASRNGEGTTYSPDRVYPHPSARPRLEPQDSGVDLAPRSEVAPPSAEALRAKRLARFGQGSGCPSRQNRMTGDNRAEISLNEPTSSSPSQPSTKSWPKSEGARKAVVVVDLTDD